MPLRENLENILKAEDFNAALVLEIEEKRGALMCASRFFMTIGN